MPTWKEIMKRQRRRKPKKSPPNIFEGEKIPEKDLVANRIKREEERLKEVSEDRKQKVKDSRKKVDFRNVSMQRGGSSRDTIYGEDKEDSFSRSDTAISRCTMCANKMGLANRYKRKNIDSDSETGRMRYCKRCAASLGMENFELANKPKKEHFPKGTNIARKIQRRRKRRQKGEE